MVFLKITFTLALATLFLGGCASGDNARPPYTINQSPVGVEENAGTVATETNAGLPEPAYADIAAEQPASQPGADDAVSDGYEKCINDFQNFWHMYKSGFGNDVEIKETCTQFKIEDSGGTTLFEVKLRDNGCKLDVYLLQDSLHIDTTFVFCSTGD
ncbi:MAG: hypothetical protein A2268_11860 [Candidatus Raymondbacteria bacterium RifOxyA12_full_50_37]|uniref:Lipoprotein n=1 Tax=Candidatus Raymondbacteria bacterium RIFOXYD12_FULL_49_13 TaxID=1817890 RepID=A0A1F7FKH0_UNCRA|nr:MAG: hypothetical protein A2268_11860 [Candidatus Raymondbacteria bacterium RifOxyA12_full_50_37]OGJ91726.1 MAG: hypothetical protein A2248_13795 [Candidatus Raymondbacteria bacterium RIFOXYA2_FULL_49_16]OGK03927.1 MAG: hypothetical protein A2350_15015 [Candidatus Raymondbacteria bacterium RifOxyB12_full_50_8]OGK06125.1 MAG: hypothetical protein A2487_09970 [Candidatus Raymondbacteria bacterium RifOxyC12_full_50_8]OGK06976.1 MAG: hypothetical protein A2519_17380 [Candidatus Raymondbacteria b